MTSPSMEGVQPGDASSEAAARDRFTDTLIGRTDRPGDPREGSRREEVGGEHPNHPWSHGRKSPPIGHAPPQYRTKRWPEEAPMEGWFPLECGERACLQIAGAAESRTKRVDRSWRAAPEEPTAKLSPSRTTRRTAPPRTSSVTRGVDAGRQAVPALGKVSFDIPLYGRTDKLGFGRLYAR